MQSSLLLLPSLPPKLSFFTCHHVPQPPSLSNLPPLPYHTHDTLICSSTTRNNININNKESPWDPYDNPLGDWPYDRHYDRNGKKKSPWDPSDPYDPYDPYEDLVERHEEKRYPWDPFDPNENPVERHEERKKNPWDVPCVPYDDLMNPWHPWDPPNEIGFESRKHKPVWSDDSDTIVSYKELEMADNDILIDGDKFHKISFPECDFFIRKPQGDLDNDLYDFREVYVKPPESDVDWIPIPKNISLLPEEDDLDNDIHDFREVYVKPPESNVYWIPKVLSPMPEEHTRCSIKVYYRCINNEHARRKYPEFKIDDQTTKVFLIKHCENRRVNDPELFLDFEETYVLDGSKKSITRAKVSVTVPEARNRDKLKDMMIRCLKEDSFEITRMYSDYRVD